MLVPNLCKEELDRLKPEPSKLGKAYWAVAVAQLVEWSLPTPWFESCHW